jgi:FKBP-type peptidyl-prolyl cis-trans isomerase (trigger factor)
MKTEVKKIDSTKREISVEVDGEKILNKFEDVFSRVSKEAKIQGFRPGHAPRDLIEKQYGAHVHEQALKELLPEAYNEAINKEGLDVIELPEIFDVKLDRQKLSFKAKVEIAPQITLKDYKKIKISYKKPACSEDEINRALDSVKESRKLEALDDSFARSSGYPAMQDLRSAVERQIIMQKDNSERARIENDIAEALLKSVDVKAPESLFKRQLEDMLRQAKVDLALKGVSRENIDSHDEALRKELEPQAERQVRIYLVMAEIARKENIPVDDHMARKVMELLLKEADWNIE